MHRIKLKRTFSTVKSQGIPTQNSRVDSKTSDHLKQHAHQKDAPWYKKNP
jgi:hypothetical protein